MIPRFSVARPHSLDEAFRAFDAANGNGTWYAGGTELLQVMKIGLAQVGTLIDLKGIEALRGVDRSADGGLRIGALTTHRELERSELVRAELPGLAELEAHVANIRVRSQGTIGGNLAFSEPHSDPGTFLLVCGARVELAGPSGSRTLGIDEFVLGPFLTVREPEEILVAIHVPARSRGEGRAYAKAKFFERPAVSVAIRLRVESGRVVDAVVGVGSITEVPLLVPAAAAPFVGAAADADGIDAAVAAATPAFASLDAVADLNGSPDYKRHLAGVLLGRAAQDARAEALAHA